MSGIWMSISTTSGCRGAARSIAARPSAASPQTVIPGWLSRIAGNPRARASGRRRSEPRSAPWAPWGRRGPSMRATVLRALPPHLSRRDGVCRPGGDDAGPPPRRLRACGSATARLMIDLGLCRDLVLGCRRRSTPTSPIRARRRGPLLLRRSCSRSGGAAATRSRRPGARGRLRGQRSPDLRPIPPSSPFPLRCCRLLVAVGGRGARAIIGLGLVVAGLAFVGATESVLHGAKGVFRCSPSRATVPRGLGGRQARAIAGAVANELGSAPAASAPA